MLVFNRITWRNFLSTGNAPVTIQLDDVASTLIVGTNGTGKSTLLDALSFSAFGKPHRNINKPQLINSINNKDCWTKLEFQVGGSDYVVIRGMKPNIFEIWQDGVLLNQESHSRDYQKVLEQNILKLNYRVFHQVVVLGSGNFVPFMQLPSHARRAVIEDLLDIGVFTQMNQILKNENLVLKERLQRAEFQVESTDNQIALQTKHIIELQGIGDQQKDETRADIKQLLENVSDLELDNDDLWRNLDDAGADVRAQADSLTWHDEENKKHITTNSHKIERIISDAKFYDDNDTCPKCEQDIDKKLKEKKLTEAKATARQLAIEKAELAKVAEKYASQLKENNERFFELDRRGAAIRLNDQHIKAYNLQISQLKDKLEVSKDTTAGAEATRLELTEKKAELETKRADLLEERIYNDTILDMLKDGGIKTKVIRQYLPIMNRLINNYLQVLDFFVSFHLDDSFNETIRSRHRDNFVYGSFSEGEKSRIDLALLFAWKQVAKLKNSVDTNLLILDETFDSSLDAEGVDNLKRILNTLPPESNVVVISHKSDVLEGKFDRKLEFAKDKNFSKVMDKSFS